MHKDVAKFIRTSIPCQHSKIVCCNKTPLQRFKTSDARFAHIHCDIVGPLLECNQNLNCRGDASPYRDFSVSPTRFQRSPLQVTVWTFDKKVAVSSNFRPKTEPNCGEDLILFVWSLCKLGDKIPSNFGEDLFFFVFFRSAK